MADQRVSQVAQGLARPGPGVALAVGDVGLGQMDERVEMSVGVVHQLTD
jgi:hypothetical protein